MCIEGHDAVEAWLATNFFPAFENGGIQITSPAKAFFADVIRAQIDEGIVSDLDKLLRTLHKLPLSKMPTFYVVKYGNRPVTFNRAVRLIGDLHDQWLEIRGAHASQFQS